MKEKIKFIHNVLGVPYTFISGKIGISATHLNLWLNDKRNLSKEATERLYDYYNDLLLEVKQL